MRVVTRSIIVLLIMFAFLSPLFVVSPVSGATKHTKKGYYRVKVKAEKRKRKKSPKRPRHVRPRPVQPLPQPEPAQPIQPIQSQPEPEPQPQPQTYCMVHNLSEAQCIDAWIARNNLNQYGDPQGTMYAGGTPLFDESTGTRIDRYTYIKSRHPDAPWWSMP